MEATPFLTAAKGTSQSTRPYDYLSFYTRALPSLSFYSESLHSASLTSHRVDSAHNLFSATPNPKCAAAVFLSLKYLLDAYSPPLVFLSKPQEFVSTVLRLIPEILQDLPLLLLCHSVPKTPGLSPKPMAVILTLAPFKKLHIAVLYSAMKRLITCFWKITLSSNPTHPRLLIPFLIPSYSESSK